MDSPKVSVLMSVYNNDASIDASIQSIVDQTFQDWEMVLINDASTDESLRKLLEWQRQDSRISVHSNSTNLGLASSLNKALQISAGTYIARMDGDDVALPERFKKQVKFLDEHEHYAIVSAGCILVDDAGEWGMRIGKETPQKRDFLWGSQFLHPASMIRRAALVMAGGYRVCKDTLRTEDYDLFMRLYAKGYTGYNLREPLLYYFENRKPRKIKFSLRLSEAKVRHRGFKELRLMPRGWPYVLKPLLVGLLPGKFRRRLQERKSNVLKGGKI